MPARKAEAAFVDTNVLVDATDTKRPRHGKCHALLERGSGLVFSAQVVREYLVVATRPTALNGLGLTGPDALANITELRRIIRLLPEEKPLLPELLKLLQAMPCAGNTIHDALIVATMNVHKVRRIITSNRRHFDRFAQTLEIVEPA
jgi:predicted nucleic acid-binding protein